MDRRSLQYHFRPEKGWINDPNGLCWFRGHYHVFYQHAPHYEIPWQEPMHWGHARTKDFIHWEELPVALCPDQPYDEGGCWSGTAIVKDDVLYLFYASIHTEPGAPRRTESVSVAYSTDGIHFEKYPHNPVIKSYPAAGCPDFRDPAVMEKDGRYYLVMATGNEAANAARLLVYESEDLLNWQYGGVLREWAGAKVAECPSFMPCGDGFLLTSSVCLPDKKHFFSAAYGHFDGRTFDVVSEASVDRGPDQYAGQAFLDGQGRHLLLSWIPDWSWKGFAPKDIGCMSLPKELIVEEGKIRAYPVQELQHLLKDSDPCLKRTADGFVIQRSARPPVVYQGEIRELKLLRDEYILEVFVNGGEQVFTVIIV